MNLFTFILLFMSNLILIKSCINSNERVDEEFISSPPNVKNILIFNQAKYNSGSTNKNGDLIIKYYSQENTYNIPASILFYGLSKNGRYCFSDESSYTKEKNIDIDKIIDIAGTYNNFKIYDSKSLFISLKNDPYREKQYLFNINTDNSIIEFHDFNNDAENDHYIWDLYDFFNLDEEDFYFPYETVLYELEGKSLYIIAFIPKSVVTDNFQDVNFIIKFSFKSFDEDSFEIIRKVEYNNYIDQMIIGTFFMDDCGILVTISSFETTADWSKQCLITNFPKLDYIFKLFNEDLRPINPENELYISAKDFFLTFTEYIYFKPIYLKNNFVMFAYISCEYLFFELFNINIHTGGSKIRPSNYDYMIQFCYNKEHFLSDFIKINERKLAYFLIHYDSRQRSNLVIKIIEINSEYNDYWITISVALLLEDYIPKMQISGFIYNDFLSFTSTAILKEDKDKLSKDINYLSLFMVFGYPNGTDITLDTPENLFINEELDIESQLSNEFYELIYNDYTIENNIFDYEPVEIVKLVSIPDEITIFEKQENAEISQLKNNSLIYPEFLYGIKQNTSLIKTSKYYYIDYQYMVKNWDTEELYYGRTNRLKFKLCHKYCETCYELGISDEEQKCLSCLSEYQYDYLYFEKIKENHPFNCVTEGYFYDEDILISCTEINTKHYINTTSNKIICFDKNINCPSSYPIYNETTKECFKCDIDRFKNGECPAENLTMDSCTLCDYDCFKIGGCNFNNFDNENDDFYERIIQGGYITNYDGNSDMRINNGNGFTFQITNIQNELNNLNENTQRNLSIIDFKDCAELLRIQNGLNSIDDLIMMKYENDDFVSNGNEKSIQYEVYLNNNTKLDLSVCKDTDINIYIPVELSEETQKLYESLKEQGYNLFDINDKFYHDICTLYKSIDGTDVILLDRINDIYEKNKFQCQENCEYSDYLPESKYLKCECHVTNEEKIDTKNPKKITAKSVGKSFFNVLKYSNYKVLRCYNLVFRKITIKENVGSILSNIYFIGYLIAFGIFCYTNISYVKTEIEKLFEHENKEKKENFDLNNDDNTINQKNIINDKEKFDIEDVDNIEELKEENKEKESEDKNEVEIIKISKKKKVTQNKINNPIKISDIKYKDNYKKYFTNIIKGEKIGEKMKHSKKLKNLKNIKEIKDNLSENKDLDSKNSLGKGLTIFENEKYNEIIKYQKDKESKISSKESKMSDNKSKISEKEGENLTDFELNDLEYDEALELDKRNFLRTYWYLLKREHIILFTFINCNDYNLFSTKLSKLFLSICSDMAFNVFFFSDESMHKIYESGGEHGWVNQFAQMVYSTIISQILQIFLNYLTMTDIQYYHLKELRRDNKLIINDVLSVIKCIKYKMIIYYSSTFILFLFFWYTASAFCAVYPNTQGIYVADSYTSFCMGLIYPFALYLAPAAIRVISLKAKEKKNLKILYSLSDKLPFF